MTELGIMFLIVGAPLFVFGLYRISKNRHVSAENNSVAIGGDNNAPIKIAAPPSVNSTSDIFWKIWALITGVVTLVGFAIQFWSSK